ncbi:glycoside hydrolase family 10 protein [Altericista sp. CCNU0014]|uniref:glycoside hydrolase family 10 protein n=1 Tax=Altericista sp. CCNU0014 TaxID=3082949 RepID=UPI0038501082
MKRHRWAWRNRLAVYLTALFATLGFILSPQAISKTAPAPTQELRGVWLTNIDSDVLFSRDRLKKGIRRLANLNFNTVYPTVWNWGYTLYPSPVAAAAIGTPKRLYPDMGNTGQPDAREAEQGDRDMLQELIELARAKNMSVIPWLEFGLMAPANSDLAKRHPDWLTQRQDGSRIVKEGRDPRVWLNPFHPKVQQLIADLMVEIVTQYDVEGIQLDDHFGLPVELGYDPFTVKLYQQEHQGKKPPKNPRDKAWMRWRADKITNLMSNLFKAVKAKNPKALISLSPNPADFSYEVLLQDWRTWEQLGYIEELVIQVYRQDRNRFLMELERPELQRARQHIPVSIGILSGLKNRDVPMDWIQQQVEWVRDRKFAGVSFFFYETLWTSKTESLDRRSHTLQTLFEQSVQRPTLAKKS